MFLSFLPAPPHGPSDAAREYAINPDLRGFWARFASLSLGVFGGLLLNRPGLAEDCFASLRSHGWLMSLFHA
jgi:hypothetical protein